MRYLSLWLLFIVSFTLHAQDYFPKNDGVKQSFKNFTAIQNATIYLSATQKIENATLLIKENKIVEVGTGIVLPKGAEIIDAKGKTIYPSFIELYLESTNQLLDLMVILPHSMTPIVKAIIGMITSNLNTMPMKILAMR